MAKKIKAALNRNLAPLGMLHQRVRGILKIVLRLKLKLIIYALFRGMSVPIL